MAILPPRDALAPQEPQELQQAALAEAVNACLDQHGLLGLQQQVQQLQAEMVRMQRQLHGAAALAHSPLASPWPCA